MGTIAAGQRIKASDFQWKAWTPTLTNLTQGAGGTLLARYRQLGPSVEWYLKFIYGTGSAVGTNPQFTLPLPPAAGYPTGGYAFPAWGRVFDASAPTTREAEVILSSGSTCTIQYWNATPAPTGITSIAPWTWTTDDRIFLGGTYEAA